MLAISIRTVWAYRRRFVGMLVAVVTGVAFLAGTLLLGDTLSRNFDQLFTQANAGTDVVLRSAIQLSSGAAGARTTVPASLVQQAQAVPGVAAARPYLEGFGQLLGSDGKSIGGNGPPTMAANWISVGSLNSYRLVSGHAPKADDEVVINRGAARSGHLRLGDTTTLLTPTPVHVRIVGIATFGSADGFGAGTFAGMTLTAAQHYLTADPSRLTEVLVSADPGVSRQELLTRLRPVVGTGVQAITGDQLASENTDAISSGFLRFVRIGLTVFALVALMVAVLSIYNTFAIIGAQRVRESALLRALGGSRLQLVATGVVEMIIIGLVGGVIGLAGGVALAALLKGVFDAFGFALPAGGLVFTSSAALISLGTGLITTVLAGLLPTIRAAKVAPMAALRESAAETVSPGRVRVIVASAALLGGVVATVTAALDGSGVLVGVGAVALIVAAVVGAPLIVRPVGVAFGVPLAHARGITGELAAQNVQRNPRRTAASALALLIGVAVVALFTVVGASLKASSTYGLERSLQADLVVDVPGYGGTSGNSGLSSQLVAVMAAVPGVQLASATSRGTMLLDSSSRTLTAANLDQLGSVLNLGVRSGTLAGADGIAVSQSAAHSNHWQVGSSVSVTYPDGARTKVPVVAIYQYADVVGDYLLAAPQWAQHTSQQLVSQVFINVAPGASVTATESAIAAATQQYGAPRVQDRADYITAAASGVNTILGLVYVMLALAIVIALLGITNTLSLAIHERRRELGLLRAIGQMRSQTRAMIRWESVLTALFGTLGGVSIGSLLGWAMVRSSESSALAVFALPIQQLLIFTLIGCIAGVLAGIRPARRAARVNVLDALSY